ncbi:primosomal protein N' [Candidatus Saccharibacteria bacterium]|nr:primosomal protein N' [Candidatus Saccharibacteria bacterium]
MYYYEVVPSTKIGSSFLTYHSSAKLPIGAIVEIPISKKMVVGVVFRLVQKPSFTTKPITKQIYQEPLPKHLVATAKWLSEYYVTPLPQVVQTILPRGTNKNRRLPKEVYEAVQLPGLPPLNQHQQTALNKIQKQQSNTVLLHGITGSGKTNIYIRLALDTLAAGKSAIILVPEIALLSQLTHNLAGYFPNVFVLHSGQTEAERHLQWQKILQSTEATVVIGPRSALFAPVNNLGLIVVDEAHEPSYKQEQSPKYNALHVASFIAKQLNIKSVVGTATPPVVDYYLAQHNSAVVEIATQAVSTFKPPKITVVDLKNHDNLRQHRFFSNQLLQSIEASLRAGRQCLIFHNRRGSAPLTICDKCGWQALCPKCLLPLTLHSDEYKLICHTCGKKYNMLTSCPECGNSHIVHRGVGTKLIEAELRKLFPKNTIARFDSDTPSQQSMQHLYNDVKSGKISIIIGTQTVAKGFDLPNLGTVGVVQADQGLALPDFSSEERAFQLLYQVIGRAGRSSNKSEVIIQTYQPENPIIVSGQAQDYASFYNYTINKRKLGNFPPFCYLLKLVISYKTEKAAITSAQALVQELRKVDGVEVLGVTPAFHERLGGNYRWQIVVKSASRRKLLNVAQNLTSPRWQKDLDPGTLL